MQTINNQFILNILVQKFTVNLVDNNL